MADGFEGTFPPFFDSGNSLFGLLFDFFQISKIEIKGTALVDQAAVRDLVYQQTMADKNIWQFNGYRLEELVKERFPVVRSVVVQKGIPDTIRVIVKERQPELVWQTGNKRYLIDSLGVVFSDFESYQGRSSLQLEELVLVRDISGLPVELNSRLVTSDWVEFVKKADRLLVDRLSLPAKRYTIEETAFDLTAVSQKGKIIFDTNQEIEGQLRALETALKNINRKQFVYLDLRIKGWVYYK